MSAGQQTCVVFGQGKTAGRTWPWSLTAIRENYSAGISAVAANPKQQRRPWSKR